MLLPSSIHRAEDLAGMAMPMVGLLCAKAPPDASATEPASASANNMVFLSMLHSRWMLGDVQDTSPIVVVDTGLHAKLGLVTSPQLASLTSGSGRPRAATSIRKVRPCSGSAARAASSMPCQ